MSIDLVFEIKNFAEKLGFDLSGIASARDPLVSKAIANYQQWLDAGYGADMEYLKRHLPKKANPERLLKNAKTVCVFGLLYDTKKKELSSATKNNKIAAISNYTRSKDYHDVFTKKLSVLSKHLESAHGIRSFPFVDFSPVLERFWAWRAGLGWIGKNTLVINRKLGSYFFLGGLLLDKDLPIEEPGLDHCGNCRKCIEACPTQAILENQSFRQIDSNLCIGYHTIENKGKIPEEIQSKMENWVAGCDVCQQVCPWNYDRSNADWSNLESKIEQIFGSPHLAYNQTIETLQSWSEKDFKENLKGVAMQRMKFKGFRRNLAIAAFNQKRK